MTTDRVIDDEVASMIASWPKNFAQNRHPAVQETLEGLAAHVSPRVILSDNVQTVRPTNVVRGSKRRTGTTMLEMLAKVPSLVADLGWLGRQKGWLKFIPYQDERRTPGGEPGTQMEISFDGLKDKPGYAQHGKVADVFRQMVDHGDWPAIAVGEALTALYAGGPKRFTPTEEQWEAMEQVQLNVPLTDLRLPYPAMVVTIPPGCRVRVARQLELDTTKVAKEVLVRLRTEEGENPVCITQSGSPGDGMETFYLFQHQEGNETVEKALSRNGENWYENDPDGLFEFGRVVTRAALNLCQMLTHFGYHTRTPAPEGRNNRAARRALANGQVWSTVHLKQEIVVRKSSPSPMVNQPGLGVGTSPKPHWVKGHWRSYPGRAAERRAGGTVPLLFIRPYLQGSDRIVGDHSKLETSYHV